MKRGIIKNNQNNTSRDINSCGIDKIVTAWAEQNWKKSEIDFSERNGRIILKFKAGQEVYILDVADIRNSKINSATVQKAIAKEDKIFSYQMKGTYKRDY